MTPIHHVEVPHNNPPERPALTPEQQEVQRRIEELVRQHGTAILPPQARAPEHSDTQPAARENAETARNRPTENPHPDPPRQETQHPTSREAPESTAKKIGKTAAVSAALAIPAIAGLTYARPTVSSAVSESALAKAAASGFNGLSAFLNATAAKIPGLAQMGPWGAGILGVGGGILGLYALGKIINGIHRGFKPEVQKTGFGSSMWLGFKGLTFPLWGALLAPGWIAEKLTRGVVNLPRLPGAILRGLTSAPVKGALGAAVLWTFFSALTAGGVTPAGLAVAGGAGALWGLARLIRGKTAGTAAPAAPAAHP